MYLSYERLGISIYAYWLRKCLPNFDPIFKVFDWKLRNILSFFVSNDYLSGLLRKRSISVTTNEMSTLIVLIFLVAFYDVIDKILLGVPPWIIIISTLIIYRVCRTISSWRRWRKPFGSTYYQLISGKILRFLRKHVPFIRK